MTIDSYRMAELAEVVNAWATYDNGQCELYAVALELLTEYERLMTDARLLAEEWDDTRDHAVAKENARRSVLGVKSRLVLP